MIFRIRGVANMITNKNNVSSNVLFMAQQFQNMALLQNGTSGGTPPPLNSTLQPNNNNNNNNSQTSPVQECKSSPPVHRSHLSQNTILNYDSTTPKPTPRDNSSTHLYQNQPILSRRNYDKSGTEGKQINYEITDKQSQFTEHLLLDFERLLEDRESADVVFLLGSEPNETAVYAHRAILRARYV